MGKNRIEPSREGLLLNAEAFGFGPSVAVASIFPYLRSRFKNIGFVGTGHTLDVQRKLPYNATYDITGLSGDSEEAKLKEIASKYDVFFTAMDFPMAKRMRDLGIPKIARYDALAWYWPQLPEGLGGKDLYLAQDFFGVSERLEADKQRFTEGHVVPPLIPKRQERKGDHVLINLGGLQNPLWTTDVTTMYARRLIAALYTTIPTSEKIMIATSKVIAERIGSPNLIYTREEMKKVLAQSKYAFMTPGLGNIYDSAVYGIPTIWLPPANDSQGQQLDLLRENGMLDGSVDWSDTGTPIDYHENQRDILEKISRAVRDATIETLGANLEREQAKLHGKATGATTLLLDRFGSNGEERVAELLYQFAQQPNTITLST